jgi:penicillin amidase
MNSRIPARPLRRTLDCLGALLAVGLLLTLSIAGLGPAPALGPLLDAGTGLWRLSPDSGTASSEAIAFAALDKPATVGFEANGTTHIVAGSDQDLFRLTGYVDARYRLVQMDLERRQASSELSEILGDSALDSDQFELELGIRRAAQRDWDQMSPRDPARDALTSFAQGVNAGIQQLSKDHQLPAVIKLLGYTPRPWTPVDSLSVQRLMTQTLSFTDTPLTFSYAANALPAGVFHDWYPDVSANPQVPYDQGPYQKLPLSPLPTRADTAPGGQAVGTGGAHALGSTTNPFAPPTGNVALPVNAVHYVGNSNAWVIAGSHTASGKPILAADPHLQLTLPSSWFQMEGTSPGYHFSGVMLPGIPAPLMGKTDNFAWAVTNAQRPSTLFYLAKTDPAKPGQYFYRGKWAPTTSETYAIKVKGKGSVQQRIDFTAQGPIVHLQGVTAAVWYAGVLPSQNLDSLLSVLHTTTFAQFRDSLRGWVTPALNFVFAGNNGDIGAIDPGVAPQVPGHDITLPLPADGSADVAGSIPFDALPSSVNPSSGYIITANNREVAADYPYEYSTSFNFVDAGYRAQTISQQLSLPGKQTPEMSLKLQNDVHDSLAQGMVPEVLKALDGQKLTTQERQLTQMLGRWGYSMDASSPEAYFFQKFIVNLVYLTFEPWWSHYKIPGDPLDELPVSPDSGSFSSQIMYGDLLSWIKTDPQNKYFSLPDGTRRTAPDLLADAFHLTVTKLNHSAGSDFSRWQFGQHNLRQFPSLLAVDDFDAGPFQSGSDGRTINSGVPVTSSEATGGSALINGTETPDAHLSTIITTGASWRFVVDLSTGAARASLPGGTSENPISPWYSNGIPMWLKGGSLPVLENAAADRAATTRWRLTP